MSTKKIFRNPTFTWPIVAGPDAEAWGTISYTDCSHLEFLLKILAFAGMTEEEFKSFLGALEPAGGWDSGGSRPSSEYGPGWHRLKFKIDSRIEKNLEESGWVFKK